jgi:hypothetical protein
MGKKSTRKMGRPPYSPNSAPCDFWLLPKLNNSLKGQIFGYIPDIQRNVTKLLRSIPENDFEGSFR